MTIAAALASELTRRPVRGDIAMTGEITLSGRVLPVGGIKEKCLAALRAKITNIIIPERNKKDIEDIPKDIRKKLNFTFVKHMDDVLKVIFKKHKVPGGRKISPRKIKPSGRKHARP